MATPAWRSSRRVGGASCSTRGSATRARPAAPTPSPPVTCCWSPTATATISATRVALAARLRPAWPCIHELSLWLSRRLPGGADQLTGMNKGGSVDVAGMRVTMVRAEHSAGDWAPEQGVPLYLGEPVGFVVDARERAAHLPRRRYRRLRGHGPHRRAAPAGRGLPAHRWALHDGSAGGRQGGRAAARAAPWCPSTTARFPALAGTPDQLRAELQARGLGEVNVLSPQPGQTVG